MAWKQTPIIVAIQFVGLLSSRRTAPCGESVKAKLINWNAMLATQPTLSLFSGATWWNIEQLLMSTDPSSESGPSTGSCQVRASKQSHVHKVYSPQSGANPRDTPPSNRDSGEAKLIKWLANWSLEWLTDHVSLHMTLSEFACQTPVLARLRARRSNWLWWDTNIAESCV